MRAGQELGDRGRRVRGTHPRVADGIAVRDLEGRKVVLLDQRSTKYKREYSSSRRKFSRRIFIRLEYLTTTE